MRTRDEMIEDAMRILDIARQDAEFIVALELGETKGDVIIVDANGKPVD